MKQSTRARLLGGSAIKWCDWSIAFWLGCTKVSPGCDDSYAWRQDDVRLGWVKFGNYPRRRTSPANRHKPYKWDAEAAELGWHPIVFCNVDFDFFDNQAPAEWRLAAWDIIRDTPHLRWVIFTKRPQNILGMLPPDWGDGYPNVWLGVSVENQREAERRIPLLLAVLGRLYALSCEPLLEPLDLRRWLARIGWVIVGGESGSEPRYMEPDWARGIRDQWQLIDGCAFLMKQMTGGESVPIPIDLQIEQYPK